MVEKYLLAEGGKTKVQDLTEGITNLLEKPLLEPLAIMYPNMFSLIVYTSEQKDGGYSEEELNQYLTKHNDDTIKPYELKSDLDRLVDFCIFTKSYDPVLGDRYFLMPVFAEYFIDLRPIFDMGGPDLLKGANIVCGKLLMKDKFFETKNA